METAPANAYAAWWRVRSAHDPVAYVHGVLAKPFLSDRRRGDAGVGPTRLRRVRSMAPEWGRGTPVPSDDPPLTFAELEVLASASWNLLGPSD